MSNQTFTRKPSQQCQLTWTNICFHLYSTYRHTPCTTAANACQKQPWCLFQQRCGITADSSTREQKVAWWRLGDQNFIENYYKSQYFFVECINVRLYSACKECGADTNTIIIKPIVYEHHMTQWWPFCWGLHCQAEKRSVPFIQLMIQCVEVTGCSRWGFNAQPRHYSAGYCCISTAPWRIAQLQHILFSWMHECSRAFKK